MFLCCNTRFDLDSNKNMGDVLKFSCFCVVHSPEKCYNPSQFMKIPVALLQEEEEKEKKKVKVSLNMPDARE